MAVGHAVLLCLDVGGRGLAPIPNPPTALLNTMGVPVTWVTMWCGTILAENVT